MLICGATWTVDTPQMPFAHGSYTSHWVVGPVVEMGGNPVPRMKVEEVIQFPE